MSPAAASRTTASAICATTRADRALSCPRDAVCVRPPSRSVDAAEPPRARRVNGNRPSAIPAPNDNAKATEAEEATYVNDNPHNIEWVGLGPYKLKEWKANQFLEIEANDKYYRGRPPLDRIIFKVEVVHL